MKIDYSNLLKIFVLVIASAAIAYYGQPFINKNDAAVNVLVTIFSVMAGFLVAILAIVGDPLLLPEGSWRLAELTRKKIQYRLIRHKMLFELYLWSLAFILLALLFRNINLVLTIWLERIFLFFSTMAFIVSFRLPKVLMEAQSQRIEAIIEQRRAESGIKPEENPKRHEQI